MEQQAVDTIRELDALVKKAEWMRAEIIRNATLRASDFDALNNMVREGFNAYTR